jgi:RES domain-containing protein
VEGQRVLYCADQEATAVAEVRPARGFYVSIAPLTLRREVRILDLAHDAPEINPFVTETLRWDVEIQSLLEAFAEEMSRPLERGDDPTHYVPCQRLADYIRDAGYDGIRYPSALAPEGTNVIFFDPAIADMGESKLVKITDANLKYEDEETDPLVRRIGAKEQPG